jgi:hypothetical protein
MIKRAGSRKLLCGADPKRRQPVEDRRALMFDRMLRIEAKVGERLDNKGMAICASARESGAPRQKCVPPPKARWLGSARLISKPQEEISQKVDKDL